MYDISRHTSKKTPITVSPSDWDAAVSKSLYFVL